VHDGISGVNYTRDATPVGIWETWHDRRGDVARAILYLDVRYEGLGGEPDLIATDDVALIVASATGSNEPIAYMGLLTTLRLWHAEDPPDAKERHRNDVVYIYQQNRNPFIDYPEWVEMLFGDPTAAPDLPPAWAARVQIAGVAPNPFNPVTAITYRVSAPGPISLDIFALDGRRVRTLTAGNHAAGEYRLIWDGRGDDAGAVASGAYVLRLAGGGDIDRAKLLLLK